MSNQPEFPHLRVVQINQPSQWHFDSLGSMQRMVFMGRESAGKKEIKTFSLAEASPHFIYLINQQNGWATNALNIALHFFQ